jgi:hypothetical protein
MVAIHAEFAQCLPMIRGEHYRRAIVYAEFAKLRHELTDMLSATKMPVS